MKIKKSFGREYEFVTFVGLALEGDGYAGQLEAIEQGEQKTREALARLIEHLYKKGNMTLPELSIILYNYDIGLEEVHETTT